MNHSCDPTCWFTDEDPEVMVACRDIQEGEEITYDYATSETINSFHANWVYIYIYPLLTFLS